MSHLKRERPVQQSKKNPESPSSSGQSATGTREEIQRLIREISEKTLKSPDKAAKILTQWMKQPAKSPSKKKAA